VGIICSNSNPLAQQPNVCPSVVAMSELVVYRAREFPEYHRWVSKILGVSKGRLIIIQECTDALSVVATVESGRGVAVAGRVYHRGRGRSCSFRAVCFRSTLSGSGFALSAERARREYQKTRDRVFGQQTAHIGYEHVNYLSQIPTVRTALHQAAEELKRHLKQLKCPDYLPAGLAISFTTISKAYDEANNNKDAAPSLRSLRRMRFLRATGDSSTVPLRNCIQTCSRDGTPKTIVPRTAS
jgi:hypothetical protein